MVQCRFVLLGFVFFWGAFKAFAEPGPTKVAPLNMIQRTGLNVPAPEVRLRFSTHFNLDPARREYKR